MKLPRKALYPTSEAQYDGKCPGCGGDIERGDRIAKVEGDWVCDVCLEEALEE